jgi:hypothetical protein
MSIKLPGLNFLLCAKLSADLSATPPLHTCDPACAVLRQQQDKFIRDFVGIRDCEPDSSSRKIEDLALVKSEGFSPNPGIYIVSSTGHAAIVIAVGFQTAAYAKS